jgi:hypothetical protein
MKAPLSLLLLLSLLFVYASVAGQEKYITVGSGGGITGAATVFKITSGGKVFKGTGLAEIKYNECARLKKSSARKFISRVSEHLTSAGEFDHPGNLYYFVSLSGGTTPQQITWGDARHPVGDDLKNLYTEIQSVVSTLKYRPVN